MTNIQLKNTIEALSKIINISDEKKEELYAKYSIMPESEIIKELSQISYRMFSTNTELYDYALDVIRNINPEICPQIDEMKSILSKMFLNEEEGNMSLEENHQLINESLIKFTALFNQYGIDYYIVGALPCFIKTGQQLFRYHDDIDIMVNEEDIPKIAEIMELTGYKFYDDRFPTIESFKQMQENKPPHTVLAQNPNNEFHLGFFTFRRENDNSITMTEYSHRLENDIVMIDLLERKSTPIGTSLRYDETPTTYLGTTFKTSTVESVYSLKSYTKRPKDITDIQKLEPFIDRKKLEELKKNPNINVESKNIKYSNHNKHK